MCYIKGMAAKKRGRRPKPKKSRKSATVQFRVTEAEKALLEEAAEVEKLEVSSWLRALALKSADEILGK